MATSPRVALQRCAWCLAISAAGCSSAQPETPPLDECAGVRLPECPGACAHPPSELEGKECGLPMRIATDTCGDAYGNLCSCVGFWQCTQQAPPEAGCNRTCR